MTYYLTDKNNKIVSALQFDNEDNVPQDVKDSYLSTDREIIATIYNGLMFADEVDQQAEEQAKEEQQQAEALKPTVEDLAEALDILTNIVLGGE